SGAGQHGSNLVRIFHPLESGMTDFAVLKGSCGCRERGQRPQWVVGTADGTRQQGQSISEHDKAPAFTGAFPAGASRVKGAQLYAVNGHQQTPTCQAGPP